MSEWRPFEPSREAVTRANPVRCDNHDDCRAADWEVGYHERGWGARHQNVVLPKAGDWAKP